MHAFALIKYCWFYITHFKLNNTMHITSLHAGVMPVARYDCTLCWMQHRRKAKVKIGFIDHSAFVDVVVVALVQPRKEANKTKYRNNNKRPSFGYMYVCIYIYSICCCVSFHMNAFFYMPLDSTMWIFCIASCYCLPV